MRAQSEHAHVAHTSLHVWAPTCVPSRCPSTKFPRRSSAGSSPRSRCWSGTTTNYGTTGMLSGERQNKHKAKRRERGERRKICIITRLPSMLPFSSSSSLVFKRDRPLRRRFFFFAISFCDFLLVNVATCQCSRAAGASCILSTHTKKNFFFCAFFSCGKMQQCST